MSKYKIALIVTIAHIRSCNKSLTTEHLQAKAENVTRRSVLITRQTRRRNQ